MEFHLPPERKGPFAPGGVKRSDLPDDLPFDEVTEALRVEYLRRKGSTDL